jgi:orotate phosphoribosyltransferase
VLILEDVTTTGGSLVDTVEVLRAGGAEVTRAITVVDREQGGKERLQGVGVELESLETLSGLREGPA